MAATQDRFSTSYLEARERFRTATERAERGAIEVVDGLTMDWAWLGRSDAPRVLMYTSGLHGIEGFGGGAAQLETLTLPPLPDDVACLYVHALNPWGWHHLRRVNEENVDLNRNFLPEAARYEGAPEGYAALDPLLNPATPPGGFDAFWLKAGWAMLTQGYGTVKNAVVSGQYAFPKGLFYGGDRLQTGPARLLPFLLDRLTNRQRVVHVDWHSALGPYGGRTLLLEGEVGPATAERVRKVVPDVRFWDRNDPKAYVINGGLTGALLRQLPGVRYDGFTCEFGTKSNLQVLAALREENRLHHWGTPSPDHPAKKGIREAFAPTDPAWMASVIERVREVHRDACTLLQD